MSTENKKVFSKENLDFYLNAVSKEYKKLGGRKTPAEIILVGGAAVLAEYGFRDATEDIDAVLNAASTIKEAVNRVGDRYNLPTDWLNSEFLKTDSFSQKLVQYSKPYKTFSQVFHVRIITGEYLIAMKLRAARFHKNDLSDIIGIFAEHKANGKPITYEMIDAAVNNLYGGWKGFSEDAISFLQDVLSSNDFQVAYTQTREEEIQAKELLQNFFKIHPDITRREDIKTIIKRERKEKESVLSKLGDYKSQPEKNDPKPYHEEEH